ncbi:MAG TPA: beta-propeller fold lactonase family protein, partial [Vicinamibacteria bacterium]|nr:beta-propeller fold lactonase family protein [Vicinamibacteria bacterium]
IRFDTKVLPGDDYRVRVDVTAREEVLLLKGTATFWGVPADHLGAEGEGPFVDTSTLRFFGAPDYQAIKAPFLSNSTACSGPQQASIDLDSWQDPGKFLHEDTALPALESCGNVPFEPSMSVNADNHHAGVPAGYSVDLEVPQIEAPYATAVSHLKDATVTLPQGTTLSPAIANGLQGCSSAAMQIGTEGPASCPAASKIGTAEVETPLLPDPLTGDVFVGEPLPGNKYRLALSLQGHGVDVKLEGKVTPDPATGRLTAAGHAPVGGKTPRHFTIDPSGSFILAGHQGSGTIAVLRLDPKTGMPALVGSPVKVDKPVCLLPVPKR